MSRSNKANCDLVALLDSFPDAVIVVDDTSAILHCNVSTEKIFGYARSELMGANIGLLLPMRHHQAHSEYVHGFVNTGNGARNMGESREITGRRADGVEFTAEAIIGRLDYNGQPAAFALVRDVSRRQQPGLDRLEAMNTRLLEALDARLNSVRHHRRAV